MYSIQTQNPHVAALLLALIARAPYCPASPCAAPQSSALAGCQWAESASVNASVSGLCRPLPIYTYAAPTAALGCAGAPVLGSEHKYACKHAADVYYNASLASQVDPSEEGLAAMCKQYHACRFDPTAGSCFVDDGEGSALQKAETERSEFRDGKRNASSAWWGTCASGKVRHATRTSTPTTTAACMHAC